MRYIGQTLRYRKQKEKYVEFGYLKRFQEHVSYTTRKDCSVLGKAIIQYGACNFTVSLVEECSIHEMDDKERQWIDFYDCLYPKGYNVLYGPPYAHSEEARMKISQTLKAYFNDTNIRCFYSQAHRNHFKQLEQDNVSMVHINPIKQNGENKIVYMYIYYEDGTSQRRRYGGIHEDYEDAFNRCYKDALSIVDSSKVMFPQPRHMKLNCSKPLKKITIRIHTMRDRKLVAVFLKREGEPQERHVFGGRTISIQDAYKSALEFVNHLMQDGVELCIKENLKTLIAATSSN